MTNPSSPGLPGGFRAGEAEVSFPSSPHQGGHQGTGLRRADVSLPAAVAGKRGNENNPWASRNPVRIDLWVLPWTTRSDMMLQLQLAYMLSRDDFYTRHSYLRVCSVVGGGHSSGSRSH